tara:strand:- start:438 stop:701 length:264 start_codon:yes stop_codon:yes gene_type:complete
MFIITLKDVPSGVYSVFDESEDRIIPVFEEEDDAVRYLMHLEEDDETPELEINSVDIDALVQACIVQGQKYSIISSDDFIIPPPDRE